MSDTAAAIRRVKALAPAFDQYVSWYARVRQHIFYPETLETTESVPDVAVMLSWIKSIEAEDEAEFPVFEDLKTMHRQLMILAQSAMQESMSFGADGPAKPDQPKFSQLDQLFENFMHLLKRVEIDCLDAFSGFDPVTGLRNQKSMYLDLKIELDRLGRNGEFFCLALARINNYKNIQSQIETDQFNATMTNIAAVIKRSLRSFDDLYRLDNGDFIMCLKQTKNVGGTAVTNRIREFMKEEQIHVISDNHEHDVTMSYCLAEPFPKDQVDDLLANMRADLDTFDDEGDTALEYIEKSPLQRFLEQSDE